ncbi:MAG: M56 family metallopeptidase [Planctomycetota bacterium]|jgi:beta-lactamase regulating signal transducer with metallopeptidase domain/Ca2+-binding EF-hand superfamily protein
MRYLEYLTAQPQTYRLGLSLLHFLWQGAVVAMVVALITPALRRRSAALRYVVLLVALGLMALLPVATFCLIESPAAPIGSVALAERESGVASMVGDEWFDEGTSLEFPLEAVEGARGPVTDPAGDAAVAQGEATSESAWIHWIGHIQPLLPWAVLGWGVGVLFLSVRLAANWLSVARLIERQVQPVADSVRQTAERLCESLGIRHAVTLLESALVRVPTVVGFWRPVILLPVSALVGLSPEQFESLLAHELAHIRRYDYLANLLQSVVETLLFYHPAVWWLSDRIRAERENCSDDIAVSVVGNRLLYAQALVDMAKLRNRQRDLAVAASGSDLRSRIQRVMGVSTDGPSRPVIWWIGAVLLTTLVLGMSTLPAHPTRRASLVDTSRTSVSENGGQPDADFRASLRQFRLLDRFNGRLDLDWEVVRPVPTHISLGKHPGRLTISSELGGLHSEAWAGDYAKNLFLIRNPAIGDRDFVVTTCIEKLHPKAPNQQAGLHVCDDDDNYINVVVSRNLDGVLVGSFWESDGDFGGRSLDVTAVERDRLWLRLTKCGDAYESAYSLDGREYSVITEHVWGNGTPRQIGLAAMNGHEISDPLDAAFDFFQVRALTAAEKSDPVYGERQKLYRERQRLRGTWEVVSCRSDEGILVEPPYSWIAVRGSKVTVAKEGELITSEYTMDIVKEPTELVVSGIDGGTVTAIYSVQQDSAVIRMDPLPGAAAPTELEAHEGNGRLLMTLRRMSAVEAAALERNARPRWQHFSQLDQDKNKRVTMEEFLVDYPTPEAAKRGTELFELLDNDRDHKLTLDEYRANLRKAMFLRMDLDSDGALSEKEFAHGEMKAAPPARARRVFELVDKDHDGLMDFGEFLSRSAEAWLVKLDTSEDGRLSYDEYAAGNRPLVRNNRCRPAFAAVDRNGDGSLSVDELANKPRQELFIRRDADADQKLTFEELLFRRRDPGQIAAAKEELAQRDLDGDGLLTLEEYTALLTGHP